MTQLQASRVTSENRPKDWGGPSNGLVRPWRWVSTPRCAAALFKGHLNRPAHETHSRICTGGRLQVRAEKCFHPSLPSGSPTSTKRMSDWGKPRVCTGLCGKRPQLLAATAIPVHFHGLPWRSARFCPGLQAALALALQRLGPRLPGGWGPRRVDTGRHPSAGAKTMATWLCTQASASETAAKPPSTTTPSAVREPAAHLPHHLPDPIHAGPCASGMSSQLAGPARVRNGQGPTPVLPRGPGTGGIITTHFKPKQRYDVLLGRAHRSR